jgi:hypothetical protein
LQLSMVIHLKMRSYGWRRVGENYRSKATVVSIDMHLSPPSSSTIFINHNYHHHHHHHHHSYDHHHLLLLLLLCTSMIDTMHHHHHLIYQWILLHWRDRSVY